MLIEPPGHHRITAVFVVLLPYLGFTLGTFLFLLGALLFFGVRSRKILVLVPLCLAGSGYILFIAALNARLPRGIVENLLAAVF
jgi:hypothetical protein